MIETLGLPGFLNIFAFISGCYGVHEGIKDFNLQLRAAGKAVESFPRIDRIQGLNGLALRTCNHNRYRNSGCLAPFRKWSVLFIDNPSAANAVMQSTLFRVKAGNNIADGKCESGHQFTFTIGR